MEFWIVDQFFQHLTNPDTKLPKAGVRRNSRVGIALAAIRFCFKGLFEFVNGLETLASPNRTKAIKARLPAWRSSRLCAFAAQSKTPACGAADSGCSRATADAGTGCCTCRAYMNTLCESCVRRSRYGRLPSVSF